MSTSLGVRNLTSAPLSIKRIEQFQDPNTAQSKPSGYLFRSRNITSAIPSAPKLGEHAGSFKRLDVSITLAPYESHTIDQQDSLKNDGDELPAAKITLRLTIEDAKGSRHRIDTHPSYTQNIPGTHNSHAHYRALPSVRCQVADIETQLDQGIRFLDIRLQPVHATDPTKKDLFLVHARGRRLRHMTSTSPTSSRSTTSAPTPRSGIHHLLSPTSAPSAANSSSSDATPRPHPPTAWTPPPGRTIPHTPFFPKPQPCLLPPRSSAKSCSPPASPEKIQHVNAHLVRAAACQHHIPGVTTDRTNPVPPGPLYLNFLSASNFWNRGCWPGVIAGRVNKGMEEWLCGGHALGDEMAGVRRKGDGDAGTGVVVMDFVGEGGDWDMVRLVVGMNMGVLMKVDGTS
ncbi:hypothetical protein SNOG_06918 [Parastagonospora nodorum SN15]|uniref:Phosphatidylinositol-specific phospholipase C X domain-containing protein n=1 Tax=Phaeosphaeria nodorum (strain SN15 / ATCC MYA-4574 / FGSC 10173) TaxID=321614 RepID=Q0UMU6_PHANO|nr:hypothetical protein SNOG_06918 [Parastagonospora nodorum SN15]EAT85569.1 hypothetical protein SNOG_06918 [Parastagonospora nodorum SN15]